MKGTALIIKKELKRVFTNKQMIFSMYILPAILMFAIYGLMGTLMTSFESNVTEHIARVYVVDEPESFETVVKSTGYSEMAEITRITAGEYESQSQEIEDKLLNGDIEMIITFESDFYNKFKNYSGSTDRIPEVTVAFNSTEEYSSNAASVFRQTILEVYRQSLQAERFGDINSLNVFDVETRLVEKEEKQGTQFLSMLLPYMIVLMLFASAMSVVIDAIAGEKERGTMSSMLLAPVRRSEIVVGKLVALTIISALSALVYCVSMIFAIPLMGSSMGEQMNLSVFGGGAGVALICNVLLLDILFVAILALLSVIAKDTKTASTFVSPCYIIVIIAGVLTMFGGIGETPLWKYFIPVYGNALVVQEICSGEMNFIGFLSSCASVLVCTIIVVLATAKAFKSEKIMFNA